MIVHSTQRPSELISTIFWRDFLAGVSPTLDDRDEMYRLFFFEHGLSRDRAALMYLISGREIWRTVRDVALWRFGSLDEVGDLLDFGAGFGRVTRFMAGELGRKRVTAAEIQPAACAALREHLGVEVIATTHEEDSFAPGRDFDVIVASSLFTHLPRHRFEGWLANLASAVSERGILLVSTHDLAGGGGTPAFRFEPTSESERLGGAEYGSTWITEAEFRSIAAATCPGRDVVRIPRGFARSQDLYVIGRNLPADRQGLAATETVDLSLESFGVDAGGILRARGWLADRVAGRRPEAVVLRVGRRAPLVGRSGALVPRPDADRILGERDLARGFEVAIELGSDSRSEDEVVLAGEFAAGREVVLLRGSLSELSLLALAYRFSDLKERLEKAETKIEWMASSRFWKLRNVWWRLRGGG